MRKAKAKKWMEKIMEFFVQLCFRRFMLVIMKNIYISVYTP